MQNDELSKAIDSFGKTALEVKRQRDVLLKAFLKIRDIIMVAEGDIEEEEHEQTHSAT